jgi:hypothetical protein
MEKIYEKFDTDKNEEELKKIFGPDYETFREAENVSL